MNKTSREELKSTIQTQFSMMSEQDKEIDSLRAENDRLKAKVRYLETAHGAYTTLPLTIFKDQSGVVVGHLRGKVPALDEALESNARLRNDLLAYGQHLESCMMLVLAKTKGWKYAKLHGCSCGFDTAKEK